MITGVMITDITEVVVVTETMISTTTKADYNATSTIRCLLFVHATASRTLTCQFALLMWC